MNEYLKSTYEKLISGRFSSLHVVLGNESCDLDSAASALAYAAFRAWQHQRLQCKVCTRDKRPEDMLDEIFVGVLNVPREDFDLKTEVVHELQRHGISEENLVFMYQAIMTIAEVSSPATIVLDTANCSRQLDKATAQDEEALQFLESVLQPHDVASTRAQKLRELVAARASVATLSAARLLRKDAKRLPSLLVPSLPLLAREFLSRWDAQAALAALGPGQAAVLLLGARLEGGLARDAAVYCADEDRRRRLCAFLEAWTPSLDLHEEQLPDLSSNQSGNQSNDQSGNQSSDQSGNQSINQSTEQSGNKSGYQSLRYYRQGNLSASRKQYMPALQAFLDAEGLVQ